jgi:hypothetical protein
MKLQTYILITVMLTGQSIYADLPGTLVWSEQEELYALLRYRTEPQSITLDGLRRLTSLCRVALKSKQFAVIQLFSDRADKCLFLTKGFHLGYVGWSALYDVCDVLPLQAGEIISWRGGIVARLRDATGHVQTSVLEGRNPLRFRHGRFDLEIVHFALPRGMGNFKESRIAIYARVKKPITEWPVEQWRELFAAVRKSLPFRITGLDVRSDAWFIGDSYYPVIPPFVERAPPPSLETHLRSKTLECWGTPDREECIFVEERPAPPR